MAQALLEQLWRTHAGIVSTQVLSDQLSFWDALIIEGAHRGGARRLVSEDLQAGRRIAGLLIENPFAVQRR